MTPVIDHVVINVRGALDEAERTYRRLGFTLTPRGRHSLGSSNHLAVFGQDYLELLGAEPGREASRMDIVAHPLGLAGLAFKPAGPDLAAAAPGAALGPVRDFHRPVELPGGAQDARFRTANLDDGRIVNGRVFLCHHFTPELVWRDEWRGHANGAVGLAEVVVAAEDPGRTAGPYRDLFGADSVRPVPGGHELAAGPAVVRLLTPAEVARRFGAAVARMEDGSDRMVALVVRVADVGRAAQVVGRPAADGEVVVPQDAAFGTALVFQA